MKINKNNNKVIRKLNFSRKSIFLVLLLAVIILVVNIITASFSWFQPSSKAGANMQYQDSAQLRPETCTFATYRGTLNSDNSITYGSSPVTGSQTISSGTQNSPSFTHFRTSITNSSQDYPTCVSLYMSSLPSCNLGVIYPSNSYRTFTETQNNDVYIIRNAYVKINVETDVLGPGLLNVDWFIKNYGNSFSIDLNNLYLMYN